ncbi:MAG: YkvA family protein [Pyrinomonadaceae bacterium]
MSDITKQNTKMKRGEKSELKGRMRSFLMFLPNMVMLLGRLLKDSRVPTAEKALFLGAIVYVISPLDLIPDILPFIGQVDDLYVVALTLLRLVNRTDESVVRQHWSGGGDIIALTDSIANIAPKLLPKRVSRVLTSRVELAPAGKVLRGITKRDEALVREIAGDDIHDIDARSRMAN